jgi:hypothetical protein
VFCHLLYLQQQNYFEAKRRNDQDRLHKNFHYASVLQVHTQTTQCIHFLSFFPLKQVLVRSRYVFLLNFHCSGACINGHTFRIMRVVVRGTHGYNPYPVLLCTRHVGSMFSVFHTTTDATIWWPFTRTLTCIKIFPRIISFWFAISSALDVLHFTASFQGYLPVKYEKNKKT